MWNFISKFLSNNGRARLNAYLFKKRLDKLGQNIDEILIYADAEQTDRFATELMNISTGYKKAFGAPLFFEQTARIMLEIARRKEMKETFDRATDEAVKTMAGVGRTEFNRAVDQARQALGMAEET